MNHRFKEILAKLPAWLLSGGTLTVILWLTLSSRPFGSLHPHLFPGSDKLAHALMFGFLTAMICLDKVRKNSFSPVPPKFAAIAALFSSLVGVIIEFLQDSIHTGRSFEIPDMISDVVGAVVTATGWYFLQPKSSNYNE